jgi:hypothetical protein
MREAWIPFSPAFDASDSQAVLLSSTRALRLAARSSPAELELRRERIRRQSHTWPTADRQRILCSVEVLSDLISMGWKASVGRSDLRVRAPDGDGLSPEEEKARVRRMEQTRRDQQLATDSVRRFVQTMERPRAFKGRFVSIFDLMRDGDSLSQALKRASSDSTDAAQFSDVVRPYVQIVDTSNDCALTGMRLIDIWRYFRHTWSNQYQSVPGRSLLILVRDAAVDLHPVIGLAALSSPVVALHDRDKWIGWEPDSVLSVLSKRRPQSIAAWMRRTLETSIGSVFIEDLLVEGLISPTDLSEPDAATIARLREFAAAERERHHRFGLRSELKGPKKEHGSADFWRGRARTHLFRSKRAAQLADHLETKSIMAPFLMRPSRGEWDRLVSSARGRRVIRSFVRRIKAGVIGSEIADISVCGAVAPYSHLLGGKLVAMLAASPVVLTAYRERYCNSPSEIASALAGEPVIRGADLAALTTTSLYGVGSSQYNRVSIPAHVLGVEGAGLRYQLLGKSESYGTSQFSEPTVSSLVALVQQTRGGQRVNSIFGEGASPRLRKIREGLDLLGLPSNQLLRHGRQRLVYGVALVENPFEFLMGLDSTPHFLMDRRHDADVTQGIVQWWSDRWLRSRVKSDEVLQAVAQHNLTHPVAHGARVSLPGVEESIEDADLALF